MGRDVNKATKYKAKAKATEVKAKARAVTAKTNKVRFHQSQ